MNADSDGFRSDAVFSMAVQKKLSAKQSGTSAAAHYAVGLHKFRAAQEIAFASDTWRVRPRDIHSLFPTLWGKNLGHSRVANRSVDVHIVALRL